jgi:L-asparagine transporter-like permease
MDTLDKKETYLNEELKRDLKNRHIQFIAFGSAIGVGLFLGSAIGIKFTGPSLILSYIVVGLIIFIILRALGEIAIVYPVSGSFSAWADHFFGPFAGYITGWTYWFMWVATVMAEITAIGIYVKFWIPFMPQWIPALISLIFITLLNLTAVKVYGETEFWLSLIKIITIIFFIVAGALTIFIGLGNNHVPTGFGNLFNNGGFFPNGIKGFLFSLIIVSFSYLGIEIIAVTAGEAHQPEITLPSAIDKVLYRIILFYVLPMTIILSIYPWSMIGTIGSPFVTCFSKLGISAAGSIVNFVVITAALSTANGGLFSTGRMLYTLSLQKNASSKFGKLNKNKVPYVGIAFSFMLMLIGVVLNYFIPTRVFEFITSVATVGALYIWMLTLIMHLKFRKSIPKDKLPKYHLPFSPILNIIGIVFLVMVIVVMAFMEDELIALCVAGIWFGLLIAIYYIFRLNKKKIINHS